MTILFFIGGVVFGAYYIALISYSGIRASFAVFWLALSVLCWLGVLYVQMGKRFPGRFRLPLSVHVFIVTSVLLFFVLFAFVESRIVSGMTQNAPEKETQVIVVLGAQVRGTRVSKTLRQRLDAAIEYWEKNPESYFIVCGGQGAGEEISEAQAMYEYLMVAGVPKGRVFRENKSTNTIENLKNCLPVLQYLDYPITVVTSDFHLYRAMRMAELVMEKEVSGLPAKTDLLLLPNYMVREFFSVVKAWFFGQI